MDPIIESAENAIAGGDVAALERLLAEHPDFFRERLPPHYTTARAIIAGENECNSWEEYEALERDSPFEQAVEAIISGDEATLERLLRTDPELIRARSPRRHHSTLLHYAGANGVEGFRQKTPKNAVRIAEILLDAGAEIDAPADMYGGGSTTLGLVATSIHPVRAGVQEELMAFLLDRGAAIDQPAAAGNAQSVVNGCLANGRPAAAEFLARRGARLDLEGAAGIGWLDEVKSFFDEDGRRKPPATEAQMKSGFHWACEYGHIGVVEFLLARGIEVGAIHRGETGLHWASCGGHPNIVRLLLAHHAPVDVHDERWNATPLGWARYCRKAESPEPWDEVIALLEAAGAEPE